MALRTERFAVSNQVRRAALPVLKQCEIPSCPAAWELVYHVRRSSNELDINQAQVNLQNHLLGNPRDTRGISHARLAAAEYKVGRFTDCIQHLFA